MERALPANPHHSVETIQILDPAPFTHLPAPDLQSTGTSSPTTVKDNELRSEGQAISSIHQHNGHVQGRKRLEIACDQCRLRKIKCEGGNPCEGCNSSGKDCQYRPATKQAWIACNYCRQNKWKCEKGRPCRNCRSHHKDCQYDGGSLSPYNELGDVQDTLRSMDNKIDAIRASINHKPDVHGLDVQSASSLKRKHANSPTVIPEEGSSALSPSTIPATEDRPREPNRNFHHCLVRYDLCRSPKDTSLSEQKMFFIHAFIPGRTFTNNHSFSNLLRQHDTLSQTRMMPILTTLYLEQVKRRFCGTAKRKRLDEVVNLLHCELWKRRPTDRDCLYFTLLANQYMIIRPRLTTSWSQKMVPFLRSHTLQNTLLHHGDLGLRLKINSYWIFSDVAYGLYPEQPGSFLLDSERDLEEIDPLVGLSPSLLNIYASVTRELLGLQSHGGEETTLYDRLTRTSQQLPRISSLPDSKNRVLANCASAYLHGAYIYVLCRHQRRPVSDLIVQHHRNKLYQLLDPDVLPLSGDLFRAVWPLLPAFILCVTCINKEERYTLREGLIQDLHQSGSYSNIPPALDTISMVWLNREIDMLKEGWWEDMVAAIGPERISLT